ncbi:MAG: HAMP domain-containing sensor histidine kinase [Gaiellaceae bacterium]
MSDDDRLALLAHELQSPVAALQTLSAVARSGDLTRLTALAVEAGRDIERLLSDPDVRSLRLQEIDLVALLEPLAQQNVTWDAEPADVVCDPTRMRQALANLVANGRRHGTVVTVTGRLRDGRIVVEVTDDGPGIAPGIDVFERGLSGVESSGYGLWLARVIAEAHGGTLTLESTPGSGATFTVSVPSPPVSID